jgi:serine/threonine-protein kinase
MGEVYRARDTRLERDVALKVLPGALVENPHQLARFEREAKLLAALNHPNVATIYGIDHVDGVHFITLELVPGASLRERLAAGPLPVEEAVDIAKQIAAGLQAAHATGIVHRDLKPGNVMIRPDGNAKILDFGLAKQTDVEKGAASEPLTEAYQVLGTPGYLSPEQASGEVADERADVWAFGAILYECLTGRRAFPGDTVGERIRAMFEGRPDLDTLPVETPSTVRLVISRCLARESSDRLRSIGDVKLLLEGAQEEESRSQRIEIRQAPPRRSLWPLAAIVAGLVTAGLLFHLSPGDPSPMPVTMGLPPGTHLGWRQTSVALSKLGQGSPLLAISPDGNTVAYCVEDDHESFIHIHEVGKLQSRKLEGTNDGRAPFFSPDGKRLGFQAKKKLWIAPVDGSELPKDVCAVLSANFSAAWSPDGHTIVFTQDRGLRSVSLHDPDPSPTPLTDRNVEAGEVEHLHPHFVGHDQVLFTVATGVEAHIALWSRGSNGHRVVIREGSYPRFAIGRLVYVHGGGVHAVRFDPQSSRMPSQSRRLLADVYTTPGSGGGSVTGQFDVSANGRIAYAPAPHARTKSFAYWVDRDSKGGGTEICRGYGDWKHPRLDPNEESFAVDVLDDSGRKNVRVWNLGRDVPETVTRNGMSLMSAYAPGGALTLRNTHFSRLRNLFGSDPALPPLGLTAKLYADCWSRDGKTLFITRSSPEGFSLWTYTRGDPGAVRLLDDDGTARFGRISPDNRWLAYVAQEAEDSALDVFVRAYGTPLGKRIKITTSGGGEPVWSKSKNELFFRKPDGSMYVVAYEGIADFNPQKPVRLWDNEYDPEPGGHQHYDISKDGRFLMVETTRLVPDNVHVVGLAESSRAPGVD